MTRCAPVLFRSNGRCRHRSPLYITLLSSPKPAFGLDGRGAAWPYGQSDLHLAPPPPAQTDRRRETLLIRCNVTRRRVRSIPSSRALWRICGSHPRARARPDTRYGTRLYFRIRRPRPRRARPRREVCLPARVICPFVRRHLKREISSVYGAPSLRSTDGRTPLLGGGNVLIERSRN